MCEQCGLLLKQSPKAVSQFASGTFAQCKMLLLRFNVLHKRIGGKEVDQINGN